MTGYGLGLYQYHQFYDKELDRYQMLPCLYMGYVRFFIGYKFVKEKWVLDSAYQAKMFVWEII